MERISAPNIRRSLYVGVPTRDENEWEILSGTAQLEQMIGDSWLATLRLNTSSIDTPIQVDRYAYTFSTGEDGISRRGDTLLVRNDFSIDRDIWSGELQIAGRFDVAGREVNVAAGIDHSDQEYARRGAYAYLGTANVYDENFAELPDAAVSPGFEFGTENENQGFYAEPKCGS